MRPNQHLQCKDYPCKDISKKNHTIPNIDIDTDKITTLMIAEAPSENPQDNFYAPNNPFHLQTTLQAFRDAGKNPCSIQDILNLGIYLTTTIKCPKTTYTITPETINNCTARILEHELNLFPNLKTILLMGDTAIKALNLIARRTTGKPLIPSGPTYKMRKNTYHYKGLRVYPTYLQTGKSYLIEKSKRTMIAEDLKAALQNH